MFGRERRDGDRRGLPMLEALARDVRYGLRSMRRTPGFTAAAILTLGLGIGATTAIFTVVNAALLRPLPYPEPDRLVYVKQRLESGINFFTWPKAFAAWRNRSRSISQIAAYMANEANLTGAGEAERVETALVTAQMLPMLGVTPVLGRTFAVGEDRPGAAPVALVSESLWRRRFNASPAIIGATVILDRRSYTVIGVVPAAFQIPDQFHFQYDVWLPRTAAP
jgi:putative ABC transport system permease protein